MRLLIRNLPATKENYFISALSQVRNGNTGVKNWRSQETQFQHSWSNLKLETNILVREVTPPFSLLGVVRATLSRRQHQDLTFHHFLSVCVCVL